MKQQILINALTLCIAIGAPMMAGAQVQPERLIKEEPHAIYHVLKNQTLLDASRQIAIRSGIDFKINAANKNDLITTKLAAEDWQSALTQFLRGYNYTIVSDKGKVRSVIVTGVNGSGNGSAAALVSAAPDLGNLPDQYKNYTSGSVVAFNIDLAKLKLSPVGKKVDLALPIGQYAVNHDETIKHKDGSSTWAGYLHNEGKAYRVYLSDGEAGLMGNVTTPDGNYDIETVDGQAYLVDLARSGQQPGGFHNDQVIVPFGGNIFAEAEDPTAAAVASTGTAATAPVANAVAATTTSVIDVMVLYTTGKQTAAYAKQRLQYLTDVGNVAFRDSKINARFRLVHTEAVKYSESASNNKALTDLSNGIGVFSGTSALRTKYGADLVYLFRPYYRTTSGSCGTTYVGFSYGQGGNAGSAFGAISDGKSRDSYTLYYCGLQTFSHESGHSLGTVHDREYASFPGKFSFSYAWGIEGQFGTIMSYKSPSVMLYSTPLLPTQCKGKPCGYAEGKANSSDQSRTINYTGPIVANYKPRTIAVPVIQ